MPASELLYFLISNSAVPLLAGIILGIDPPYLLSIDRQRVTILFCAGASLFARVFLEPDLPASPFLTVATWVTLLSASWFVGKLLRSPATRPYAPLVALALFAGYLAGTGSWLTALLVSAVYPAFLCALPKRLKARLGL